MTDISKEAVAEAWEEFEICATATGSDGDLDLYDTDGMQEHAYALHQIAVAQAARIAELEADREALITARDMMGRKWATAREDALREAICKVTSVLSQAKAAHKMAEDQNEGHSIRTGTACYVNCAETILSLIKEPTT